MEVSGAVSQRLPSLFRREISQSSMEVSGAGARRVSSSLSVSRGFVGNGRLNVDSSRFCVDGHLRYYVESRSHPVRLKKEKKAVKKKLKLLKGFSSDLSPAYESGFVRHFLDGEFQADRFFMDETRVALERQLQQLKLEEKEQKRKRKLEKAKLNATRVPTTHKSSSESSDNETNMINRSHRMSNVLSLSHPFPDNQWQTNAILPPPPQTHQRNSNIENIGVVQSTSVGKVEVCMGNKCKKAGAMGLMEEFERVMGGDGAVCGCKCMGKCRDGPNVRVSDSLSSNSLCIGVKVEDVGRIVDDYLGQGGVKKQSRFAPAI